MEAVTIPVHSAWQTSKQDASILEPLKLPPREIPGVDHSRVSTAKTRDRAVAIQVSGDGPVQSQYVVVGFVANEMVGSLITHVRRDHEKPVARANCPVSTL